jgi:tRNA modification GTPase
VCTLAAEVAELHVHGSPPLVAKLLAHFERELAPARERRGKDTAHLPPLATIEERAWTLLANPASEAGARILLDQAQGALRRELTALLRTAPGERARRIDELSGRARVARYALEPATVVLAGPVNAGKSTLFNALLGVQRAIESSEPGTTRDLVVERGRLGAWPVVWVDTAGERAPGELAATGAVERAGQERARAASARADPVLRLRPATGGPARGSGGARERGPVARAFGAAPIRGAAALVPEVRLTTFGDRLGETPRAAREAVVSARFDPEHAREVVGGIFRAAFELPEDPWCPGAGVPFEPGHASGLALLRARSGASDFESSLERWIADELGSLAAFETS